MPRKPKVEKKNITVVVNSKPIAVVLHPPTDARKSWYAYWAGLVSSKSTGRAKFEDAVVVAEEMVKSGGKKPTVADALLTDEEFEQIQRRHFGKKTDEAARKRAMKSLEDCLDAITAFRQITGLNPITIATVADCECFQHQALLKPKGWRQSGLVKEVGQLTPEQSPSPSLSPNTVLKWSRSLQAAFERANRFATRRKCVRGVVDENKLLTANPWTQFEWIGGKQRSIRQFDADDLLSFLSFMETQWGEVRVGTVATKVFLWSSCRKLEVAGLQWSSLRIIGNEYHFQIIGKWGVERWFRVPEAVYASLAEMKTHSSYVFEGYNAQLRKFHANKPNTLRLVCDEYRPADFGRWFYQRVRDWSAGRFDEPAFVHMFRKTTLQYARRGEDINRQVAADARVSETVMMTNYVKEADEELRQQSNRTYSRIVASLSPEVAERFGHTENLPNELEKRLAAALAAKNWDLVQAISARLASSKKREAIR